MNTCTAFFGYLLIIVACVASVLGLMILFSGAWVAVKGWTADWKAWLNTRRKP